MVTGSVEAEGTIGDFFSEAGREEQLTRIAPTSPVKNSLELFLKPLISRKISVNTKSD